MIATLCRVLGLVVCLVVSDGAPAVPAQAAGVQQDAKSIAEEAKPSADALYQHNNHLNYKPVYHPAPAPPPNCAGVACQRMSDLLPQVQFVLTC